MPPRPPVLEQEHVEEILLRLPPDHPAYLFRAALACKRWCRLISSPAFQRRYREFHRAAPMLAFLSNGVADDPDGSRHESRFVSVPGAGSRWTQRPGVTRDIRVLDARHGRVLLQHVEGEEIRPGGERNPFQHAAAEDALRDRNHLRRVGAPVKGARDLLVWVPITKERRVVPIPSDGLRTSAAAILCSDTTGACDHLDCHRRPFLVVFVASRPYDTLIYTYSSETATWNDPIPAGNPIGIRIGIGIGRLMPSAYVGNALYFGFQHLDSILKYDLQLGQISWIQLPTTCNYHLPKVFTTTEAGVLGLAVIHRFELYVWSRNDAPQVDGAEWTQPKVINLLTTGLTVEDVFCFVPPHVVGFEDGAGVIFFWVNSVIHRINLKTCKMDRFHNDRSIYSLLPYMSFCTPEDLGAACTRDGPSPSAGGSSA